MSKFRNAWAGLGLACGWLFYACWMPLPARAGGDELKLEIRLIWGANEPTSPDPDHKPLDSALTKWLQKKLQWKYFFEVNRQTASFPLQNARKIRMSRKCELEIKYLGQSRIEIKLIGQGKPVNRMIHKLSRGDWLIIAGDDKNNTAWFIVLKQVSG